MVNDFDASIGDNMWPKQKEHGSPTGKNSIDAISGIYLRY